jgi:hypothetical protein
MKTLTLALLVLSAVLYGCKKDSDTVKEDYHSMHFVRQGGGQINFEVYETDNPDKVKVIVSAYGFRDTTAQMIIDNNADNASAFLSFHQAINNQTQITGNYKQSTLPTGTWSYIYFVSSNAETEVTNTDLRNSLLKFEQLTTSMMNK